MERELQIERIVLGSLIADFETRWPDVRYSVAGEMFHDEYCRSIFKTIIELVEANKEVNLVTVWLQRGGTHEDGIALFDISQYTDFNRLKWEYEITQRFNRQVAREVTFADYVTQLIKNHERKQDGNR